MIGFQVLRHNFFYAIDCTLTDAFHFYMYYSQKQTA